ncbi:MAG: hypothetical protein ACRD96_26450 [Bryobacteraceae bacterium]
MRRVGLVLIPLMAAAQEPAAVQKAAEKSIRLLQSSAAQFFRHSGCISCHHQSIPGMAISVARERGLAVDDSLARQIVKMNLAVFSPHRENLVQAINTVPASPKVSSYALLHMAAEKQPADGLTDAMVHDLAQKQRANGSWRDGDRRPPLGYSDLAATALTLRALDLYAPAGRRAEFDRRIARAREWLAAAEPADSEERAYRLLGLAWAKARRADQEKASRALAADQRTSGGWSQRATLEPDAYATAQALVALHHGGMTASDPVYQRGVKHLLATQREDGSWHVKTRAMGFQPYFESGFPHGPDQWISAAATGWAVMALAYTR